MAVFEKKQLSRAYLQQANFHIVDPAVLRAHLAQEFSLSQGELFVVGDLLNRAVLVRTGIERFAFYPVMQESFPVAFNEAHGDLIVTIDRMEDHYVLTINQPEILIRRLQAPRVKMVALYHEENFPLPRFPLGISDIAGAIRKSYIGVVSLCDMQFGMGVMDVLTQIMLEQPEIIGISATFGQQDILEEIMAGVLMIPGYHPLILFGGSLAALNYQRLLSLYPGALVGMGYGETTMQDAVRYFLGMINMEDINFISYRLGDEIRTSNRYKDDKLAYSSPELDLLEDTLRYKGVMQLESSRGCTYNCSFCPRGHKGTWSGDGGAEFIKLLPFVKLIFDRYPEITRKIFLVDEEFIGYQFGKTGVESRASAIAELLSEYGFTFESSTRVDQVYRLRVGVEWHTDRIAFWRHLLANGLDRMLFGVESGVDSILKRFNKSATSDQNVIAVRMLTTLGVPLRLTYITFDPLMTMEELIASYKFLGRKDILLLTNQELNEEQLMNAVKDQLYVSNHSKKLPLYTEVSYMLVSMESLIGSKYLERVVAEGLAGEFVHSMGKRQAAYLDPVVGEISFYAQIWIDKNFALDYLLKSILKIAGLAARQPILALRLKLKASSYRLLGKFLAVANQDPEFLDEPTGIERRECAALIDSWRKVPVGDDHREFFLKLLTCQVENLALELESVYAALKPLIAPDHRLLIEPQMKRWQAKTDWTLINQN